MKQAVLLFVKYAIPFITLGIVSYDLYDKNQYRENIQNEKINVVVSAVISSYISNKATFNAHEDEERKFIPERSLNLLSTEHLENILQTQSSLLEKCNLYSDLFKLNKLILEYNIGPHTEQFHYDQALAEMMGRNTYMKYKAVPKGGDNIFSTYGVLSSNLLKCAFKSHSLHKIKKDNIETLQLLKEHIPSPIYKIRNFKER